MITKKLSAKIELYIIYIQFNRNVKNTGTGFDIKKAKKKHLRWQKI